jgi:uncharacterized Tic20 family protein
MRGPESFCDSGVMTENNSSPAPETPPASTGLAPQPMLESDARTWAMLAHILAVVAALFSGGTLAFIAPLLVWLIYKDRSALVAHHGKENLNLQLTVLMMVIGLFITLPLWGLYALYAFIVMIVAGVRANQGVYYTIPFKFTFIK